MGRSLNPVIVCDAPRLIWISCGGGGPPLNQRLVQNVFGFPSKALTAALLAPVVSSLHQRHSVQPACEINDAGERTAGLNGDCPRGRHRVRLAQRSPSR